MVDTNVLLRFLLNDAPDQAQEAALLFQAADAGRIGLVLPTMVVFEAVFTLERAYRQTSADVVGALLPLFDHPSVEMQDGATLRRALELHAGQGLGFGDACVAALGERIGSAGIATFDRDLRRRCPQAMPPRECVREL